MPSRGGQDPNTVEKLKGIVLREKLLNWVLFGEIAHDLKIFLNSCSSATIF